MSKVLYPMAKSNLILCAQHWIISISYVKIQNVKILLPPNIFLEQQMNFWLSMEHFSWTISRHIRLSSSKLISPFLLQACTVTCILCSGEWWYYHSSQKPRDCPKLFPSLFSHLSCLGSHQILRCFYQTFDKTNLIL